MPPRSLASPSPPLLPLPAPCISSQKDLKNFFLKRNVVLKALGKQNFLVNPKRCPFVSTGRAVYEAILVSDMGRSGFRGDGAGWRFSARAVRERRLRPKTHDGTLLRYHR